MTTQEEEWRLVESGTRDDGSTWWRVTGRDGWMGVGNTREEAVAVVAQCRAAWASESELMAATLRARGYTVTAPAVASPAPEGA